MSYPVFVANANTKKVDTWFCTGEMEAIYQGEKQTLCILKNRNKSCVLPKRCVFATKDAALAALALNSEK